MSRANRALTTRLEDVQVRLAAGTLIRAGPHRQFDTVTQMFLLFLEELDQAEQRTQRSGGEVPRGENSKGAVQGHEEQHRGREEAAGPHSGETPEGSECTPVCGARTRLLPNPHQILCWVICICKVNQPKCSIPFVCTGYFVLKWNIFSHFWARGLIKARWSTPAEHFFQIQSSDSIAFSPHCALFHNDLCIHRWMISWTHPSRPLDSCRSRLTFTKRRTVVSWRSCRRLWRRRARSWKSTCCSPKPCRRRYGRPRQPGPKPNGHTFAQFKWSRWGHH